MTEDPGKEEKINKAPAAKTELSDEQLDRVAGGEGAVQDTVANKHKTTTKLREQNDAFIRS